MTQQEMLNAMNELASLQENLKAMKAREEELKAMILDGMTEWETEIIEMGGHKATSKTVNASRFDTKAFKADHEDLYNEYMKHTYQTRFTFK